jgi:predicted PhzF superfamily epimerase YddE/YHI9
MELYQVDAFTHTPFHGNPAAVCLLPEERPDAWMQAVAAEMNLSETAFLLPEGECWRLRWFTPLKEVSLCGHATLASAHALYETGRAAIDAPIRFMSQSGLLTAERRGDWIELDFPARVLLLEDLPEGLADCLGAKPVAYRRYKDSFLIEVGSEAELRGLQPDFLTLKGLPVRSVAVTCRSETPEFDFVSRYFAPQVGVNEDPVTGSMHCALVPYWSEKLGKMVLRAYQASARGGVLRLRLDGERVKIGGQAVTVLKGELL